MTKAANLAASANATAGNVTATTIQSNAASTPTLFKDSAGTQVGTLCRAWVNFTGSSGAINASFNVSSVTRASTGNYTVSFTNAMSDANYITVFGVYSFYKMLSPNTTPTTTQVAISSLNIDPTSGGGYADPTNGYIAVFR